jgi:hypothetical protein
MKDRLLAPSSHVDGKGSLTGEEIGDAEFGPTAEARAGATEPEQPVMPTASRQIAQVTARRLRGWWLMEPWCLSRQSVVEVPHVEVSAKRWLVPHLV